MGPSGKTKDETRPVVSVNSDCLGLSGLLLPAALGDPLSAGRLRDRKGNSARKKLARRADSVDFAVSGKPPGECRNNTLDGRTGSRHGPN